LVSCLGLAPLARAIFNMQPCAPPHVMCRCIAQRQRVLIITLADLCPCIAHDWGGVCPCRPHRAWQCGHDGAKHSGPVCWQASDVHHSTHTHGSHGICWSQCLCSWVGCGGGVHMEGEGQAKYSIKAATAFKYTARQRQHRTTGSYQQPTRQPSSPATVKDCVPGETSNCNIM
jgi:hypothetical protein